MNICQFFTYMCLSWRMRKMRIRSTFMEYFDLQISGSIKRQLIWYLVVVVLSLVAINIIAFCFDFPLKGSGKDFGAMAGSTHYFFHAGEWFREDSFFSKLFAGVISIFGMLIFAGLFVATVSNSIRERVEKIKAGQVSYKKIQNHYIIVGYSGLALSLIENIFGRYFTEELQKHITVTDYQSFKNMDMFQQKCVALALPKIILFSNQDTPTLSTEVYSYFPKVLRGKIHIYSGNIESYVNLSLVNIQKAKEVYVLGEQNESGRDIKNLEAINYISNLRGELGKGEKPLKVYMQFDRLTSYSIIQKLPILPEYLCAKGNSVVNILFRPFNFYENTARLLWGFTGAEKHYDKLDYEYISDGKYVHLVIVGFNRMGRALLFEALRLCHFPNYIEPDGETGGSAKNKTKITIVDDTIDAQLPTFLAEFPYLHQIEDVEITYMNALLADETVRNILRTESLNANAVLTVAICLHDSDYSMSVGLSLPPEVYYSIEQKKVKPSHTRVLIRQEVHQGISSLVNKNDTKFKHVKVFGTLMAGMREELLCDKMAMCVNAYYDIKYMSGEQNPEKIKILRMYTQYIEKFIHEDPFLKKRTFIDWVTDKEHHENIIEFAEKLWLLLSEDFRFANRYQIDMYETYIKYTGNANLAQMEHLRWNADRSIIGYRDLSSEGIKDTNYQLHKSIIPFNQLDRNEKDSKEKAKDEDVIANMYKLINFFH